MDIDGVWWSIASGASKALLPVEFPGISCLSASLADFRRQASRKAWEWPSWSAWAQPRGCRGWDLWEAQPPQAASWVARDLHPPIGPIAAQNMAGKRESLSLSNLWIFWKIQLGWSFTLLKTWKESCICFFTTNRNQPPTTIYHTIIGIFTYCTTAPVPAASANLIPNTSHVKNGEPKNTRLLALKCFFCWVAPPINSDS